MGRPIKIDATSNGLSAAQNSNSIQDALEALPNFAIPEIEVDVDISTAATPKIDIYFTDAHNTGQQSLLVFKPRAQCEHGSQPQRCKYRHQQRRHHLHSFPSGANIWHIQGVCYLREPRHLRPKHWPMQLL